MPFRLTKKVVSPDQKRVKLTWYTACDSLNCKGEYFIMCDAGYPGQVWVRCRTCGSRKRIKKPVGKTIKVEEIPQWSKSSTAQ
jgi:hypothetical protein